MALPYRANSFGLSRLVMRMDHRKVFPGDCRPGLTSVRARDIVGREVLSLATKFTMAVRYEVDLSLEEDVVGRLRFALGAWEKEDTYGF